MTNRSCNYTFETNYFIVLRTFCKYKWYITFLQFNYRIMYIEKLF